MSILKVLSEKVVDISSRLDKPLTDEETVELQMKLTTVAKDLDVIDNALEGKNGQHTSR